MSDGEIKVVFVKVIHFEISNHGNERWEYVSKCEENSSPYPYPLFKNAPHVLDERTIRIVDAVYIQPKRCR